jgi:ketol-acid reductoisomerase
MKVFYDNEIDSKFLENKIIGIIGYGSQGHAHALNLRDTGVKDVRIGLKSDSKTRQKAIEAGFVVETPEELAKNADIIMMLAPDELQRDIYTNSLERNLKQGATLAFAHGLAIHFNLIQPRADLDVVMIAPKGPGHTVRAEFARSSGVPTLVAVSQDSSGEALKTALAYAKAIGGGRSGIIQTTFRDECETDLFGEQAVLCGGLSELVKAGFETLVEAGYPEEMAYFECLHELKLIVDLLYEGGLSNMRYSISNTAEFGDYESGPRVIDSSVKERMKLVLKDIQSGEFTKKWMIENAVGKPSFLAKRRRDCEHPIERVGDNLRKMMPWLNENSKRLVDKSKN